MQLQGLWLLATAVFSQLTSIWAGDDHEHIHIKLHLPEVLKKHTHHRTFVKHHFHPKKSIGIHDHHFEDHILDTDIEPNLSFLNHGHNPKHSFHSFDNIHDHSWDPSISQLVDVKQPEIEFPIDWDTETSFSKFLSSKKPKLTFDDIPTKYAFQDSMNKLRYHQKYKKYEDDEDEYMMTEDTSREHPITMHMKYRETQGDIPNSYNSFWSYPHSTEPVKAEQNHQWPNNSPTEVENYSTIQNVNDEMDDMSRYRNMDKLINNMKYETAPASSSYKMLRNRPQRPKTKTKQKRKPNRNQFASNRNFRIKIK